MANIILADKDKAVARVITDLLTIEGHTIRYTASSAGLISMINSKQADLILVGIQVEEEDGRALCHRLFEEKINKRIPVILVSPFFHTENEIRRFHCAEVISLPLEAADILNIVATFTKSAAREKELLN